MLLKNLASHNADRLASHMKAQRPHPNGIACPKCGDELIDSEPNVTLTSNPAQTKVHCEGCGFSGCRFL